MIFSREYFHNLETIPLRNELDTEMISGFVLKMSILNSITRNMILKDSKNQCLGSFIILPWWVYNSFNHTFCNEKAKLQGLCWKFETCHKFN